MDVRPTAIPEVLVLEPKVFGDARGHFFESWNQRAFGYFRCQRNSSHLRT